MAWSRYIRAWMMGVAALWSVFALVSCINEDTSDCGEDYTLTYKMKLKVNLSMVLDTELDEEADVAARPIVEGAVNSIFKAYAMDNDLVFYRPTTGQLVRHESNEMDGAQATYTLFMPAANYRHIALANVVKEPHVELVEDEMINTLKLQHVDALTADTVDSQHSSLFAARMDIAEQDFTHDMEVDLAMLNAATVVLIDRNGLTPEAVQGCVEGVATSFSLNDSTYNFEHNTLVRAEHAAGPQHDILYAVTLPSRDKIETMAPSRGLTDEEGGTIVSRAEQGIWQFHVVTKLNGKFTESTLHLNTPLEAGQLRILKVKLQPDGRVVTDLPDVGISVKLDWQPGGEHDVDM